MANEKNLVIAKKLFGTLILDYEWNYVFDGKREKGVYCRILIDGNYAGQLTAETRGKAIEKFYRGEYVRQYFPENK